MVNTDYYDLEKLILNLFCNLPPEFLTHLALSNLQNFTISNGNIQK